MSLQTLFQAKSGKTFVALKRFLPSMNSHMTDKIPFMVTGKGTCFTKKILLILVNRLNVSTQIALLGCTIVTQIATEVFFFMNRSYMPVQISLGFTFFVALGTFERV